ncbi:MAG: hypothetical protein QOE84_1878, partial [Actinomycetota bacterium]|nr:hypothetical protein [Actinomycetota bacterium]
QPGLAQRALSGHGLTAGAGSAIGGSAAPTVVGAGAGAGADPEPELESEVPDPELTVPELTVPELTVPELTTPVPEAQDTVAPSDEPGTSGPQLPDSDHG